MKRFFLPAAFIGVAASCDSTLPTNPLAPAPAPLMSALPVGRSTVCQAYANRLTAIRADMLSVRAPGAVLEQQSTKLEVVTRDVCD